MIFFTDELPEPINLRCLAVPHGLLVSWDTITDHNNSCARGSIIHEITVAREGDRATIVSINNLVDTQIEITYPSLESSQNYSIHIRANLIQGTCSTSTSEAAASILCRTSDDPSPTIATRGT